MEIIPGWRWFAVGSGLAARVFQNPTKAAETVAFSHGGTENTEKILAFSSKYSVFSVALCEHLLEHAKRLGWPLALCRGGVPWIRVGHHWGGGVAVTSRLCSIQPS